MLLALPCANTLSSQQRDTGYTMSSSTLRDMQSRFGGSIDAELRSALENEGGPDSLLGMMCYQLGYVDERLQPVSATAGKRFRPSLCLQACEAVGGTWQDGLRAAAAIELLHNFSLIHDDIEDRDPVRHHRPTVWRVWGEAQAINAGDSMFALAGRWVLGCAPRADQALEVGGAFFRTALTLTEGQHLDMSFESRTDVTPDEYMEMIARKTSALVSFSLWAGATLGGASTSQRDHLSDFGRELGTAFQIHDDWMGIWGDPRVTGKQAAQDLRRRKKTLPVLLAMERANEEQRAQLLLFSTHARDDLDVVLAVLRDTGVAWLTEQAVARHRARALAALERAHIDEVQHVRLASLAHELTGQRPASNAGTVTNA